jgi:hypothetical protein
VKFFLYFVTSFLLGTNTEFFSDIVFLSSFLIVKGQVSHPYKIKYRIIVLWTLPFRQQTRRRRFLNWITARIPKIYSALNIFEKAILAYYFHFQRFELGRLCDGYIMILFYGMVRDMNIYFEEPCFWTLSIVQCFSLKQRFGSWLCFRLQVKRGKGGGTYSVGSGRWIKSKSKILRNASHHRQNPSEWFMNIYFRRTVFSAISFRPTSLVSSNISVTLVFIIIHKIRGLWELG